MKYPVHLKLAVYFLFLFCVVFLLPHKAFPAETAKKKIIVFPFEVFAREKAGVIQKNIREAIEKRFSRSRSLLVIPPGPDTVKPVEDSAAVEIAKRAGADYVLLGSCSQVGDYLSIDSHVIDVSQGRSMPGAFVQGTGMDKLDRLTAQLADEVLSRISTEKRIVRVEFKGARKIEDNAILNIIKSTKGQIFSEENLSSDIKAIYKMGYFSDIRVDVEDVPDGKVIVFNLQEKPLISEIRIKGNKDIDTKDIEGVLSTKVKQFVDVDKLRSDAERIKDLYGAKAYLNAEVQYETEKRERDVRVVFNIREGNKLYIRSIKFEGNQAFSAKFLKKQMETSEKGFWYFFTDSGLLKRDKLKEDINRLNVFYLNNGYIHARVSEPEIIFDQKSISIKIAVSEGKRFKVGKVEITGDALNVPREKLFSKLNIKKKDYYDREAILKDLDAITQAANDEGYAYAEVNPQTDVNENSQVVDVTYNLLKDGKVFFNRISISGNTKTRDKVIRRALSFVEGDQYSRGKLKDSYSKLNRLRYFEEIDIQTEKGSEKELMDINVRVKEKPTGMFSIGAGYSAVDKAVIMAQISQQNLFGRGQTLGLSGALGQTSSNYELFFIEPFLFDIPLWSKFDLWRTIREYDTYDLTSSGFGATLGYPLFEKVVGYIGYRLSSNDVQNVSENASTYIKRQMGTTTSSGVILSLGRDSTDDFMFPTTGSKNTVSVEYTGGIFQGTTSFIRYTGSSAWFFAIPFDSVFGVRGKAGYIQGRGGEDIPVYERYYLGGINSIRGVRDIGPVDPVTGDVIGGTTMLLFNAEIVFPLLRNAGIKGVAFFDMGNSWDYGYHFDDMRKTAGLGIRWYSPIGPLRLEYGYVIDRKPGEPTGRWEFTIGMFM